MIGVAQYLHHGYSVYSRPAADAAAGVRDYPGDYSSQMAVVLKLYAQRVANDRTADPPHYASRTPSIIQNRLPNKVDHFISAWRTRDRAGFSWNEGAAQAVIPCLRTGGDFAHTPTQPSGVYLDYTTDEGERRYYNFGAAI